MNTPDIIPLDQFQGTMALDLTKGRFEPGGGGQAPEGVYTVTIKAAGVMQGRNGPVLTLTLSGIAGDTYDYVNLPGIDPQSGKAPEKAESYARALGAAAAAFGAPLENRDYGEMPVRNLAGVFAPGKTAQVYYIPAALSENPGHDGKRVVLAKQEVTYLTADDVAKIESGELTIARRMSAKPDPTATNAANLGTAAGGGFGGPPAAQGGGFGGQAPGQSGGGFGGFGGQAPAQGGFGGQQQAPPQGGGFGGFGAQAGSPPAPAGTPPAQPAQQSPQPQNAPTLAGGLLSQA